MTRFLAQLPWSTFAHWEVSAAIACAFGIAVVYARRLQMKETADGRAQQKRQRELQQVAERIVRYGRKVHQCYPTGDVVVSEHDLAQQLRKRPEIVGPALQLLLGQQRVAMAPLPGYWRLNV